MDMTHSCRCCLRCPPDKDLTTPYIHLGKTEIYVEMLKDCFDLQLTLGGAGSCGICSACVGRLRDASDFKLQVQRSQVMLQGAVFVKEEHVKIEVAVDVVEDDTDFDVLDEEPVQKTEFGEDETGEVMDEDPLVKPETSGNMMMEDLSNAAEDAGEPPTPLSQRQLVAASCRIGRFLHQLREKPPPCNSKTSTARYQCHDCGRTSTNKTLLKKHIKKMHTGNTHKCGFCHYNFKHKYALREHEMTHTGEKPFQCSYCDYKTRINSNLKSHIRIHTGEKPFKCDKCVYKCTRKSVLKRHMMTHTGEKPYECRYCDYKCNDQTNMKTHEMGHTGEKPFQCKYCDYKCRRKNDLNSHQRRHTREKPFKCRICEYNCAHRNSLNVHFRAKHPDEQP
ncbi:zinc finger protein 782-like isoform X2 [Cydia strobilella]|uniref:zinc finger protein 782-like isoform X2 n=1 Tax=Cydia strobilella TaxID=1100964 RepID=UPI003006A403